MYDTPESMQRFATPMKLIAYGPQSMDRKTQN
jgi:hypothetical protein